MPLSNHRIWGAVVGDATVFKYVGALCVLYAALHLSARRNFPSFFATWQARLFAVFFLIATISYFAHYVPRPWEFSPLLSYASFLLLFFVTLTVVDSLRRLRWVLLVAIGSVAFASLYMIREWQTALAVYGPSYRPGWVVGDPNYFTISALLCLPLAFYLMLERRSLWERWFCLGCLIVTLAAVTLGASRGGFLGLVVAFLFVVWHSRRRLRNLALVSALVLPLSFASPASPVKRLLHPTHSDVEAEGNRLVAWNAGLGMIRAHPLAGIGLDNFKILMPLYADPKARVDTIAHNVYVEIAAEMGVPGLLVFLAILYFSYHTLQQTSRRLQGSGPQFLRQVALGLQAGLVGCAVALFFVSGQYQKLLWLMVFLSMCLPSLVPVRAGRATDQEKARRWTDSSGWRVLRKRILKEL
jgi:O-antigen ligase